MKGVEVNNFVPSPQADVFTELSWNFAGISQTHGGVRKVRAKRLVLGRLSVVLQKLAGSSFNQEKQISQAARASAFA